MGSGYLAPVAGVAVADRTDRERPGASPDTIRKDELVALRDQVTRAGGPSPSGIDRLIENFDRVAGRGGEMTFDQFTAFAAENGVLLPTPGARAADQVRTPGATEATATAADRARAERAATGLPGDRGTERAAERAAELRKEEARKAEARKADARQASDAINVSLLSETELRTMVAKGDQKAALELERRSEVREESERQSEWPRVDVYA